MKILITGSKGMLGSDLIRILEKNKAHELIATDSNSLDITSKSKSIEIIKKYTPDVVINSAAYTDVDGCESNENLAHAVNGLGPMNLAIASEEVGAKLVHVSTDYVFNGEKAKAYDEDDETSPINVYGETKLEGEELIKDTFDDYFIVRTSWLYGYHGNNFVKTMLELGKNHDEISVVDDQRGSPTYTHDLAIAISQIIETDLFGVYNMTNSGTCSWFEFAKNIFKIANVDVGLNPVTTDEFPRPANRPKYSVLNNAKWVKNGFKPLRDYKEAVSDYINLLLQ